MKRLIAILALSTALSAVAGAQWYNFPVENGKKKTEQKAEKTEQKAEPKAEKKAEPKGEETKEVAVDLPAPVTPEAVLQETDSTETFSLDIPEEINVAMLLPIQVSGKTNSNFLGMYSGGLLALRDLGKEGLKVKFSVYDSVDEDAKITEEILSDSDVIIGPVSENNISEILLRCPEEKRIVSPLEPKAARLADSLHVVQAPSSWTDQIDGMIDWVRSDMIPGDNLVLVRDSAETTFSEQTKYLLEKLSESGLKYKTCRLASDYTPSAIGCTRFLVASDRDSYIATAIRQIGIQASTLKDGQRCIYLTSKMRNAKGVDQQYLYKAGARVTMSYFIDYDNPEVKEFILSYRALFSDEPDAFAFQGYDTVKYFVGKCAEYGRQWYLKLPEAPIYKGLQSNYMFVENEKAGQLNKAVKRVVYNPDMSTSVQ